MFVDFCVCGFCNFHFLSSLIPTMTDKFLIHNSVKENNLGIVTQLINETPQLNLLQDEDGRYPLHWACSINSLDMTKVLAGKRNVDIDELVDNSGWTPVHIVCSIGNVEALDVLMSLDPTPDINLKTGQGTTGLHLAISKGNMEVIKKLIGEYNCKGGVKDRNGYTPLHRAASNGMVSVVELLCGNNVAINATDNSGWSALHHAVAEGNGDVAKKLMELGADDGIVSRDNEMAVDVCVDERVKDYVWGRREG